VFATVCGWDVALVIRAAVVEVEREWAGAFGEDKLEQLRGLLIELGGVVAASRS
jgi:hypothetical protein